MTRGFLDLRLHREIEYEPPLPFGNTIGLPEGCLGIMFVFESPDAAEKFAGKKTKLVEFEFE